MSRQRPHPPIPPHKGALPAFVGTTQRLIPPAQPPKASSDRTSHLEPRTQPIDLPYNTRVSDASESARYRLRNDRPPSPPERDALEARCEDLWREITNLMQEERKLRAENTPAASFRRELLVSRITRLKATSERFREALRRSSR